MRAWLRWAALLWILGLGLTALWLSRAREPRVASYSRADYDEAMRRLRAASTPEDRYFELGRAAKTSVYFGSLEEARSLAEELLALVEGRRPDWNRGNAIHDGHLVLGLVALREGKTEQAAAQLLLAGDTPGSPQLDTFGPNLSLARELLERHEQAAVLEYFARCRVFWEMHRDDLDRWADEVRAGRMPDFGANLIH